VGLSYYPATNMISINKTINLLVWPPSFWSSTWYWIDHIRIKVTPIYISNFVFPLDISIFKRIR
jgi:hypothetical protein